MRLLDILIRLDACDDGPGDALPWLRERAPDITLGGPDAERLWLECERGDWLTWLVSHSRLAPSIGHRRLRLISCDVAAYALPIWEAAFPDDLRPRTAIDVARRYATGDATAEELRAARAGALGARALSITYADAYIAATAAAITAGATAYAAFGTGARDRQAEIVRQHVPWSLIQTALAEVTDG